MIKKNIIIKEKVNGLMYLYINRPEFKNALDLITIIEIKKNLQALKLDKKVRGLVITGCEDSFSSGADLKWMKDSKELNFLENKKQALEFADMLKEIDEFPKPIISLVNGHAYGGSLGIIATSDYSVSVKNAKFSFSEVKLGIIPAMIGPYIIRSIGYKNSKKLFLTGEVFNSEVAKKINLIDEYLDPEDVYNYIKVLFAKLIKGAPTAQGKIKKFLNDIKSKNINEKLINFTADTISDIRVSSEGQEGLNAFLEKRKPKW